MVSTAAVAVSFIPGLPCVGCVCVVALSVQKHSLTTYTVVLTGEQTRSPNNLIKLGLLM